MPNFNPINLAGRIRYILAKIAVFGWEPRYHAQLCTAISNLETSDTREHPQIAARAKVLAHILENIPAGAKAKMRFAEIRHNVEGLARLVSDCGDMPFDNPQTRLINVARHHQNWRRIVECLMAAPTKMSAASTSPEALHAQTQQSSPNIVQNELFLADLAVSRRPGQIEFAYHADNAPTSPLSLPKILVAEDDLANQAVLKMQLARLGYDGQFAQDGAAALALWQQKEFVGVLADRHMPGMDGLALARAIRAQGGSVPIIAITASNCPNDLVVCLAAGMDAVLPKPIELEAMREILTHWLTKPRPLFLNDKVADKAPFENQNELDLAYLGRIVGSDNLEHIRELLELFIRTARIDVQMCQALVEQQDGSRLAKLLHKIKSSARMVGALRFAEVADSLDAAVHAERFEVGAALLTDMWGELNGLEITSLGFKQSDMQRVRQANKHDSDLHIPEPVLIVDDDALVRRQLRLLLNALGISQVVTSSSAAAGLIELRQAQSGVELLVCDLNMPAMTGLAFLEQIAVSGYGGYLLVMSCADPLLMQAAVEFVTNSDLKFLGVLAKPVTRNNLVDCFKSFAGNFASNSGADKSLFDFNQAIRNDEFDVYFNAKLATANLEPVGIIAEVHWQRLDETVAADMVLELAERYGLSAELFKLLFTKSLIAWTRIAEAGFLPDLTISLPAYCLSDNQLPDFILASIRAVGFNPGYLILEIGQACVLADMPIARDSLVRLGSLGIRLSMGDVAQECSVVEKLSRVPFTEINLDIGFAGQATSLQKPEFVTRYTDMAKAYKLSVVGMGVHTLADLDLARNFGCEFLSGNLAAQAVPHLQMIEWLGVRRENRC